MEISETITFDTHRYVKRLIESGFSEQQAETLASEQVNLLNYNLATKAEIAAYQAATKAEIAELRTELKEEIAELRGEFKEEIAELRGEFKNEFGEVRTEMAKLESRLLWQLIGALFAQGTIIIALVKLL